MKKIGLVGGIGPASTVDYYLGLIERYRAQFGDDRYPEIVIDSIDMHEMIDAFGQNDYDKVAEMLLNSVENLKAAGATLAAITSNTPHIVWDKVLDKFSLPCYSIVEAAVEAAKQNGKRLGRPALEYPANWETVYTSWKAGEITAKTAMEQTGTKRTSFYKLVSMTENN